MLFLLSVKYSFGHVHLSLLISIFIELCLLNFTICFPLLLSVKLRVWFKFKLTNISKQLRTSAAGMLFHASNQIQPLKHLNFYGKMAFFLFFSRESFSFCFCIIFSNCIIGKYKFNRGLLLWPDQAFKFDVFAFVMTCFSRKLKVRLLS